MSSRLSGAAAGWIAAAFATFILMALPALAEFGHPAPGQMTLQSPATPVMEQIHDFYNLVNYIIIAIAVFVLILMIYVMVRFNERSNPEPDRVSHHTLLEVAWTVIPILILVVIAIPSFKLLRYQYSFPKPDITIKAIGNAWFWEHEYLDAGVTVSSNMIDDETVLKAKIGDEEFEKKYGALEGLARIKAVHDGSKAAWAENSQPRQLAVDAEVVLPVNKTVHLLVTSNDVIHQWSIPSFGAKTQAVPGRINATWFKPTVVGMFYGQCQVLCGKNHFAMPIAIRVVKQETYDAWLEAQKAGDTAKAKEVLSSEAKPAKPAAAVAQVIAN